MKTAREYLDRFSKTAKGKIDSDTYFLLEIIARLEKRVEELEVQTLVLDGNFITDAIRAASKLRKD